MAKHARAEEVVMKCPQDGAELKVIDTVPATYGGKSGELDVCICPKCGNIQSFFSIPKKREKAES